MGPSLIKQLKVAQQRFLGRLEYRLMVQVDILGSQKQQSSLFIYLKNITK